MFSEASGLLGNSSPRAAAGATSDQGVANGPRMKPAQETSVAADPAAPETTGVSNELVEKWFADLLTVQNEYRQLAYENGSAESMDLVRKQFKSLFGTMINEAARGGAIRKLAFYCLYLP